MLLMKCEPSTCASSARYRSTERTRPPDQWMACYVGPQLARRLPFSCTSSATVSHIMPGPRPGYSNSSIRVLMNASCGSLTS